MIFIRLKIISKKYHVRISVYRNSKTIISFLIHRTIWSPTITRNIISLIAGGYYQPYYFKLNITFFVVSFLRGTKEILNIHNLCFSNTKELNKIYTNNVYSKQKRKQYHTHILFLVS